MVLTVGGVVFEGIFFWGGFGLRGGGGNSWRKEEEGCLEEGGCFGWGLILG